MALAATFTAALAGGILVGMVSDHSFNVPFTYGLNGVVETNAGFEVDAVTETVYTFFTLPASVHNVKWIRVYARSVVAEADGMCASLSILGAQPNALNSEHSITAADKVSATTNFDVD